MTHAVDQHVGKRVRHLRKALGLTQSEVAATLGLTFQQIQKYERGSNRISASKLYEMSRIFDVKIDSFFDGLEVSDGDSPDAAVVASAATKPEVARLVRLFEGAPVAARDKIVALVEVLAAP